MGNKILICDDAAIIRLILREILEREGYEIIGEAANGKEAIEKFAELKPDILLLDISMPVMDGMKALTEIMECHKDARVIMCSAMGQEYLIDKTKRLGAKAYITKPFATWEVVQAVKKVLGR